MQNPSVLSHRKNRREEGKRVLWIHVKRRECGMQKQLPRPSAGKTGRRFHRWRFLRIPPRQQTGSG